MHKNTIFKTTDFEKYTDRYITSKIRSFLIHYVNIKTELGKYDEIRQYYVVDLSLLSNLIQTFHTLNYTFQTKKTHTKE